MSDNKVTGNVCLDEDSLQELHQQVSGYHSHAIGYHQGELGTQAKEAWDYYYGRLPEPVTKGSSKWVDRSVWESVNGTLQELVSVFTSGEDAVKFSPMHSKDAAAAQAATKMVNKILLRENKGYETLHDVFKECLVTRNSFIKRYWKKEAQVFTEEFEDMTKDELDTYMASIEGDIVEFTSESTKNIKIKEEKQGLEEKAEGEDDSDTEVDAEDKSFTSEPVLLDKSDKSKPLPKKSKTKAAIIVEESPEEEKFSGKVTYEVITEGVKVEYVPFEEVVIEPTARSIADANYLSHRVRKSKAELLLLGFDEEVVEGLHAASADLEASIISSSRSNSSNPSDGDMSITVGDEKSDKVWLHENYIKTSIASGLVEILQVFTVNNEILEVNRVNEFPFETFTPFPVPGSIWGESVFDITKDVQDLSTTLVRGMIDNIMNANFRRYTAIKGQYDRESLLNNRPGAVVEQMMEGAVRPMDFHQLPQGIDTLLGYINGKKEERTGVSKVGQGLDPAVFKNDNSTATVQMVMSAAQNRLRMVARNIAQRGMTSLMLSIYNLVRQNGKEPILIETANGMLSLDPRKLPVRTEMVVAVAVGDGERKERAQALQSVLMLMNQDPEMKQYVQPANKYYLAQQIFESMGIYDTENFLTPLDKIPPAQPDPMQELSIQQMQKSIEQLGVQTQKLISDATNDAKKMEYEQMKAADEMSMRKEESRSKQDEAADLMSIEERKLELDRLRIEIDREKVELKRQEMLVEAQIEARQSRPVSIGR